MQRIGKYKSAGDQLTRKTMSEENCEMLTALLDNIYENWLDKVSLTKGALVFCGLACLQSIKLYYWILDTLVQERREKILKISLMKESTKWEGSKKRAGLQIYSMTMRYNYKSCFQLYQDMELRPILKELNLVVQFILRTFGYP